MIGKQNYFDFAASSPPFEDALVKFRDVSNRHFANPSSIHDAGTTAKLALNQAKNEFCNLLNFQDGRLLLCGSCTEANNLIMEGHILHYDEANVVVVEDVHDSIWYATKKYLPGYIGYI